MDKIQPHLGVMVDYLKKSEPPFLEKGFFKQLTLLAEKKGMSVTVFAPYYIHWDQETVQGYRWTDGGWKKGIYPLPSLIYDRIFYTGPAQMRRLLPLIRRLQEEKQAVLLGRGLPGKWKVYSMLKEKKELRRFLPETMLFRETHWKEKLLQHQALFLKPISGSHGKGVIKISFQGDHILANGRTLRNQLFSKKFSSFRACDRWLQRHIRTYSYILQPFLELSTEDETPFDLRLLIQKDEHGRWKETGRAVRKGKRGGLTSNLHGGGTAVNAQSFLKEHFSAAERDELETNIHKIAGTVPVQLEKKHGPLFELGLDLGIDRQKNIWILEVNSKPGRKSFQICGNREIFLRSLSAPIRYADYVSRKSEGA